jgi:hypothetical protein
MVDIDQYIYTDEETDPDANFNFDENLFNRMADFIMELEPEQLTDSQIDTILGIIDDIEVDTDDIEESIRKTKKTLASDNQYGRSYYRKNKSKVKTRKKKFQNSAEAKKRERKKKIMDKSDRTPTGRKKVRYNTKGHTN